jgi:nucleoside-diphosphate-sugar epimerase
MTTLVVGATGAAGRLLVEQLLDEGQNVRVIVRSPASLPGRVRLHERLQVTEANILELTDEQLRDQVAGCDAVASCLGHNMSFKGVYGAPRRLVTESVHRLCVAIKANKPARPVRFVLMNSSGVGNRDLSEPATLAHKSVIGLLRLILPPHVDNEQAADYLRTTVGQYDDVIEWVSVRPDGLIDEDAVTDYQIVPSPTRDAIFDAGKVSRINVAHFMSQLILDNKLAQQWRGKMPVIYSAS